MFRGDGVMTAFRLPTENRRDEEGCGVYRIEITYLRAFLARMEGVRSPRWAGLWIGVHVLKATKGAYLQCSRSCVSGGESGHYGAESAHW